MAGPKRRGEDDQVVGQGLVEVPVPGRCPPGDERPRRQRPEQRARDHDVRNAGHRRGDPGRDGAGGDADEHDPCGRLADLAALHVGAEPLPHVARPGPCGSPRPLDHLDGGGRAPALGGAPCAQLRRRAARLRPQGGVGREQDHEADDGRDCRHRRPRRPPAVRHRRCDRRERGDDVARRDGRPRGGHPDTHLVTGAAQLRRVGEDVLVAEARGQPGVDAVQLVERRHLDELAAGGRGQVAQRGGRRRAGQAHRVDVGVVAVGGGDRLGQGAGRARVHPVGQEHDHPGRAGA